MFNIYTVQEFLADIESKVDFTSSDAIDREMFGDWNGRIVRLSYSVEVNKVRLDILPLQVVVRLDVEIPNARGQRSKWQNLSRWGCESNEQNAEFIRWFIQKDAEVYKRAMRNGDDMGTALSKEWNG
jgi:hypothetical protein